ncbi:MAG: SusC/RagA family TonB-linked outer membrane protein [Reichenbachiella sp.]|uniref:SusC/RagA family TonB-linked outer membrane protein n=1 Tax=Reichenbachiella sp. TaxID=2184521 RepID=UPI003266C939
MKHLKLLGFLCSLLFSTALMAQDTVSGTIIDENGEAVIGASVLIKGTTKGTTTDIDGKFSLEAEGVDATLIISYIGYEKQEVFVGSRTTIDVTMQPDLEQLEEVVITALGFKEKKDKLGSTYSTVKTEDAVRSGESNVLNSLASKASNVQINAVNGDPGAGTNIRIRGANTITGSPDPLYIIDGIPVSGGVTVSETIGGNTISGGADAGTSQSSRLNDLNPNDIESIQVLKGASAAALWGSRAANGVVVITTKNGSAGKPTISYKATYSVDKVQERIKLQNTYGQGRSGSWGATRTESWGDYIPDRAGGADDVNTSGGYFEAPDGTKYYPVNTKNSTETFVDSNWDAVIGTGEFLQHDLSVSGGSDKATYFFSLGRLDQNGIVKNSEYERTNVRFNTDFTLADWLTFKSKAGYTNSFTNRIQQSSNVTGLMLGLLRGPADFDITHYQGTYYDANGIASENVQRSYRRHLGNGSAGYNNPLWTVENQGANSKVNRFVISNELNIVPTDWLQIILRNGIDYYTDNQIYMFAPGSASDRSVGVFADDDISNREINFDAIARGDFELNSNVSLQVTLGFNVNDKAYKIQSSTLRGFSAFVLRPTSELNGDASSTTFQNERQVSRSNRGYGILNFDLFNQLNVSLSGASEAASTVKGSFFYPAVELGWRFSEQFDLSPAGITFAKLRATWGQVGIQPLPHKTQTLSQTAFTHTTYDSDLAIAQFGGGFRLSDELGDPDLVPEIKTEWEVGLDLKLFSDRVSYGVTYYQNEIKDMLIPVELAPSLGYETQYTNAATMENKGLEMDLDVTILRNSDWNVGVYGNFGQNRNEVTALKNTETVDLTPGASVSSRAIVGEPLGVLYGTGSLRDDAGNLVLDANNFPQLNPEPVILGDPNPDWKGGFGFRASWKGFALNALFEHSQGGVFSPRTLWVLRRFGTTVETANTMTLSQDLVNIDGDLITAGTTVRGNVHDFGGGNVLLDESWYRSSGLGGGFGDSQLYDQGAIKDATFTRLRELSVSYTLNSQGFRNATKLSSIVFTATGRNLFLWDNIEGIDPQVSQFGTGNGIGLEYFTNPSTKSFVFSVGINF